MIRNLPTIEGENLVEIILKIASKKGMVITKSDFKCLRAISTTKENNSKTTPPNVIITFFTAENKNTFKKRTKTDLTINDIMTDHEDNTTIIYIEENLSPHTRELFWKTRAFKTEYEYAFAWTKDGTIYLKKSQGERALRIESAAQLEELKELAKVTCSNNSDDDSSGSSGSSGSNSSSSSPKTTSPIEQKTT
jgi:hypothetical protein